MRLLTGLGCALIGSLLPLSVFAQDHAPTTAPSHVAGVTVYRGSALVRRQVDVPAGSGLMQLIVSPLPAQTVDSSLYSEGSDGVRVLNTRYRTRAVQHDISAAFEAKEQQLKGLVNDAEKITKEIDAIQQDLALLSKLENFTGATMQQLADKGLLSADTTIALSKHVMDTRAAKLAQQVQLQQSLRDNAAATTFVQREIAQLSAGSSKTEREAVIVIDKTNPQAGSLNLNYLIGGATWSPQYRLRAGGDQEPVLVEYLASIQQASGEDWTDVNVALSTAEPMLSAAPPELLAMNVTVAARGQVGGAGRGGLSANRASNGDQVAQMRRDAQKELNLNNFRDGNGGLNSAAALQQTDELFLPPTTGLDDGRGGFGGGAGGFGRSTEGPSVTFHLTSHFSLPSQQDEQLLEISRLQITPKYFYKAIPVLTPHVYRLADLVNSSQYVLLPGEATAYIGSDFVGRMQVPLVAIGDKFVAGFGVDPQIQVTREMVKKNQVVQGGNQVHELQYQIRASSFKSTPVNLQVWDRLPRGETESVNVTLLSSVPSLSTDVDYVRVDRTSNLLRWDLAIEPGANASNAETIDYSFKMEYDRNVSLGNFKVGE